MLPNLKHILYASDLSENSMPALAWAMTLSHQHDAPITLLHVTEAVPSHAANVVQSVLGEDRWKEMTHKWKNDAHSEIEDRIHKFCDTATRHMSSCPVAVHNIVISHGIPVERILQEAESRDSDLIVMGTHGAGVFKDAMIGSTARRVVRRSNIPVFVIPLTDN